MLFALKPSCKHLFFCCVSYFVVYTQRNLLSSQFCFPFLYLHCTFKGKPWRFLGIIEFQWGSTPSWHHLHCWSSSWVSQKPALRFQGFEGRYYFGKVTQGRAVGKWDRAEKAANKSISSSNWSLIQPGNSSSPCRIWASPLPIKCKGVGLLTHQLISHLLGTAPRRGELFRNSTCIPCTRTKQDLEAKKKMLKQN